RAADTTHRTPPRPRKNKPPKEGLTENSPGPADAHVSVTFGVSTKTSAAIPTMPRIAITAPGLAAARAARKLASSVTMKVGLAGHATDGIVLKDGRAAVGATVWSWHAAMGRSATA